MNKSMEQHIPALSSLARFLVRFHPAEDYKDLVQTTLLKVLEQDKEKHTLEYATIAMRRTWYDKCSRNAIERNIICHYEDLSNYRKLSLFVLPTVEQDIYCKQYDINIHEWPKNFSSKRPLPEQTAEIAATKIAKIAKETNRQKIATTALYLYGSQRRASHALKIPLGTFQRLLKRDANATRKSP